MKYIKLFENFNNTLINESYTLKDFLSSSKELEDKGLWTPFWDAIRPLLNAQKIDINNADDWDNLIKMDAISLKNLLGVSILLSTKLEKFFKSKNVDKKVASEDPTTERLRRLKEFFKSGATGRESQNIIAIYKHFKNDESSIDDLEPSLKNLYKESPGIFNFSNFTKEQFMEIVKELAKDNSSFRDYIDEDDDTPSFDISSKGTAFNLR